MDKYPTSIPLIRTKLQMPRLANDFVPRPDLIKRLNSVTDRQLTLVSAPAGYGKSTLIASWLKDASHSVCWITLDENDNDLLRFLRYLVSAVQTIYPDAAEALIKMTQADYAPPADYLAALLINEISDIQDPFVLVLDDFHLIDDLSTRSLVSDLIDNQPANLHLVIITRTDPPLPLGRLRASGKIKEIRSSDLRFHTKQAWMFLSQVMETTITQEQAAELNRRAEGWIAGLRMISLSVSNEVELSRLLSNSRMHSTSIVNEYLLSEVLLQLPETLCVFMLHSAVLDRLCGSLCDAVALINDPDWSGDSFLEWMKKANVFVISLDDNEQWYRFHQLFQALLMKELRTRYPESKVQELHRRAALWFANEGFIEEAMHHALSAHDVELAASFVEQKSQNLLNSMGRRTLKKWLGILPQETIWHSPRLILAKAWLLFREWRLAEMELTLSEAKAVLEVKEKSDHDTAAAQAQFATLQSVISFFYYQDCEQSLHLANQALANLPESAIGARGLALIVKALSFQALGNLKTAVHLLESIIISPSLPDAAKIQPFIGYAAIYHAAAQLRPMSSVLERFLMLAANTGNANALSAAHRFAGCLNYELNDLDRAQDHFNAAIEYRYQGNFLTVFDVSLGLARVYLVQGDFEKSQSVVDFLRSETLRINGSDLLGPLEAFQAYLWSKQNNTLAALNWARSIEPETVYESIVLSEVADITRAYILIENGSREEINETVVALKNKLKTAQRMNAALRNIQIRIYLALAFKRLDQKEKALYELAQALELARPGGFIRSFSDAGPAILPLLKLLRKPSVYPLYLEQIIASFPDDQLGSKPLMGKELPSVLLTPRQIEILELLKKGYIYKEIANDLGISLNTVRKHTSNIYSKLEVGNRQEAIYKAEALHLLD